MHGAYTPPPLSLSILRHVQEERACLEFMSRELFPRMDIQLTPEIAIQLYYIISNDLYLINLDFFFYINLSFL